MKEEGIKKQGTDEVIKKFSIVAGKKLDEKRETHIVDFGSMESIFGPGLTFEVHNSDPNNIITSPKFLPYNKRTLIYALYDSIEKSDFRRVFQLVDQKYIDYYLETDFIMSLRRNYLALKVIYNVKDSCPEVLKNYVKSVVNLVRETYKEIKEIGLAIKSSREGNILTEIPKVLLQNIIVRSLTKENEVDDPLYLEKEICNEYLDDSIKNSRENLLIDPIFDKIKRGDKQVQK